MLAAHRYIFSVNALDAEFPIHQSNIQKSINSPQNGAKNQSLAYGIVTGLNLRAF
jgi:hypothetical protein